MNFVSRRSNLIETMERRVLMSTAPGFPDTSFNHVGGNVPPIPNIAAGEFTQTVIQPNGRILAVGEVERYGTNTGLDILLARFNVDGSPDKTFGGTGYVITDIGKLNQTNCRLRLLSSGKIIVTSSTTLVQDRTASWIVRYNANGALDTTFGGKNTGYIASSNRFSDVAVEKDGSLIAVGTTGASTGKIADAFVEHFTSAGIVDTKFGQSGIVTKALGTNPTTSDALIYAVAIDGSGRITLVGARGNLNVANNQSIDGLVMRFTSAGKLDTTFGGGAGYVATNVSNADVFDSMRILSNGNIVVCGFHNYNDVKRNVLVVEYNSAGKVLKIAKPAVLASSSVTAVNGITSIAITSSGKIVGTVYDVSAANSTIHQSDTFRLNSDLSTDKTFGFNGAFSTDVFQATLVESCAVQTNGAIVAVGAYREPNVGTVPGVLRYVG